MRYYFELNSCVVEQYGGYQYITLSESKDNNGLGHFWLKLLANSDRVIACDHNSAWFVKHRYVSHKTAVVDPDEFFEIKLRSVEFR